WRRLRKLRVDYVIGSLDSGGSERQLLELAIRLDRSRFETSICCLAREGALAERVRRAGVPVDAVGRGAGRYSKRLPWIAALRRRFRETKPDVVHAFLFPSYALAAFAAARPSTAVVAGIRSATAGSEGRWPFSWFEQAALARVDRVVVNAEAVRAALLRRN